MYDKKCRVCNYSENFEYLIARDYFLGSKKKYPYLLCPACNSLSIEQIPAELFELYKNYYSFSPPSKVATWKRQFYKYIVQKTGLTSRFLSSFLKAQEDLSIKSLQPIKLQFDSKILDVGCGSGALLQLLYEMGFKNCLGIDPFLENDISYSTGLRLKKEELLNLSGKFDIIMFHHVFEHFPNPRETLQHVSSLLSKDGTCIIRLPTVDSYSFFRYKENWFSIHAPFHLFLPSKGGMEMIAKEAGLTVKNIVGEQLVEFFFYSMGHELGIADYETHGNRRFIEKYGINKIPSLHIKDELKVAKQRLKQVKKYGLCDWAVYYLQKKD
jgi:SAM-dependent methyltransferase